MSREFKNRHEFRRWSNTWCAAQTYDVQCACASISTIRALPHIQGRRSTPLAECPLDLAVLRAAIILGAAAVFLDHDTTKRLHEGAISARDTFVPINNPQSPLHLAHALPRRASAAQNDISNLIAALQDALSGAQRALDTPTSEPANIIAADFALFLGLSADFALEAGLSTTWPSSFALTETLEKLGAKDTFATALWTGGTPPEVFVEDWQALNKDWSHNPAMSFWRNWYEDRIHGRTPDWDLWLEIALIENELWDAGAEAVAEKIEQIQKDLREKRAERFEDHARAMIPRAPVLAKEADRLSQLIEQALSEIRKELGSPNALPDTIEPLLSVPRILHGISIELVSAETEEPRIKELAILSQALIGTVQELNTRLQRAQSLGQERTKKPPFYQTNIMSGFIPAALVGLITTAGTQFAGPAGDTVMIETLNYTTEGICIETEGPVETSPSAPPKPVPAPSTADGIPEEDRRKV